MSTDRNSRSPYIESSANGNGEWPRAPEATPSHMKPPPAALQRRTSQTFSTAPEQDLNNDGSRVHYEAIEPRGLFKSPSRHPSLWQEMPNMVLLVVLYMLQGVPLGLTMGTVPMLLASRASYTQVPSPRATFISSFHALGLLWDRTYKP
jgi:hypothetical protein